MREEASVLVADDEPENRALMIDVLSSRFRVFSASNGEEAIQSAGRNLPDLILMDINMPRLDGISACRAIRDNWETRHIPIVMFSAMDVPEQRTQAFQEGADDFIGKPFGMKELVARLDSKIRRLRENRPQADMMSLGNLTLDLKRCEALIDGQGFFLAGVEQALLRYFLERSNQVITREQILGDVWKGVVVSERTVDTHVSSLRKKLVKFDHELKTIYGVGYILESDQDISHSFKKIQSTQESSK